MTISIYTPRTLLGVFRDTRLDARSTYFRDLAFGGADGGSVHISRGQDIVFEQIVGRRPVAPFVLPTRSGVPTYTRQGSMAKTFRPAYIKPKDSVMPNQAFDRQPGDLFTDVPQTPQQNFDLEVAKVLRFQKDMLDRRLEWMAAQATLYASVKVEYVDEPTVTVDFGRDAGQSVTFVANYWSDTTHDIIGDIQSWADTMTVAQFGGIPNRLTIGASVFPYFIANEGIKNQMITTQRGNPEINIRTGLTLASSVDATSRYVGTLGNGVEVWLYNDTYQDGAGATKNFMNPKDVLLTCANMGGIMAYGAILDVNNLVPTDVFTKMWDEQDPSARFIMTQSAPLAVPVYPNRSFRARVLA